MVYNYKLKDLAEEFGYAREVKEFKANPEKYEAHVGDVSTLIRIALTSKTNTPDLYEIIKVLGKDTVIKRHKEELSDSILDNIIDTIKII